MAPSSFVVIRVFEESLREVAKVFRGADHNSGDDLGRRGRLYWILGLRKTANFEGTLL